MKKIITLLAGAFLVVAIIAGSYIYNQQANDNHMLGMVGSTKVFSFVDSEAGVVCWMTRNHLTCIPYSSLGITKEELTRGWLEKRLIH